MASASFFFPQHRKYNYLDKPGELPIVYSQKYDINLPEINALVPLDFQKYSKIKNYLVNKSPNIDADSFYRPKKVTSVDLEKVHCPEYLHSLNKPENIARIIEMPLLRSFSIDYLNQGLDSLLYATGGTILAVELSLDYGVGINLSGGFHHAKKYQGEGFCFYNDIAVAVQNILTENPEFSILIIDLDAHQGNGIASTVGGNEKVYIFDLYNKQVYPQDEQAKKYIDFDFGVAGNISEQDYINILKTEIYPAIQKTEPNLIIYNAGTDIYKKDMLGGLNISIPKIIKRDHLIFKYALNLEIPITMVLSGGYSQKNHKIVGESILNIYNQWPEFFQR